MMDKLKYKGFKVHKKPWWTFLYMRRAKAFTTLDKIYIDKKLFNELENNKLTCNSESALAHEITHIKRFRKHGVIKSELIYWVNKKFRYNEELAAIEEEMKIYKKYNKNYYFEKASKGLSGFIYLWCTDYKTAKKDLKEIWDNL